MRNRFRIDVRATVSQMERAKQRQSARTNQITYDKPEDIARQMREHFDLRKTMRKFSSGMRDDGRYHHRGRRITKTTFEPY